jgi:hypothetical protein
MLRHTALLLALFSTAGCHRSTADGPDESAPVPKEEITNVPLEVANHHFLDVTIYVVRDGQPARLGIANGSSLARFVLPPRLIGQGGEVRLFGRPIGGKEGTLSEVVVVQPGQRIEWTLESDLSRSSIGVY